MKCQTTDITTADVRKMWRPRPLCAHKGTMGHALLVSGSRGMAGSTILAAEACLRSGIGKLSILTAEENRVILQVTVPEAIIATDLSVAPYNAIGIGPGIGTGEESARLLNDCLTKCERPMVLDADALNLLALHPQWLQLIPEGSILTPHVGEAERLVGHCQNEEERLQKMRALAAEIRGFVVLKGHPTAICSPSGAVALCQAGNPGMATAGSGDVLTGIITGLLTQGYPPEDAARFGVWLHATAGDFARDEMGENCMLARDIIRMLPKAFGELKVEN